MNCIDKNKNFKRQRGEGLIGALILVAIIIVLVAAYLYWPRQEDSSNGNRNDVSASITVGADTNKPGLSKIGFICPGEAIGLAWGTVNANNAVIEPSLGEVALEGFTIVSPTSSSDYVITAQGDEGSATDFAAISVITPNNNAITKIFSAPQVDPDTGYPASLIWRDVLSPSFISENIFVTGATLVQAPNDWPYWNFRKSDPNGTLHSFSIIPEEITEIPQSFVVAGEWEGEPANLDGPIVTAKGGLEIRLRVECKK